MELTRIGYWRTTKDNFEDINTQFPWPEDYINSESLEKINVSPKKIKKMIVNYLDSFEKIHHMRGLSRCRLCGRMNGSAERSDGEFLWPEGYSHYVKEHGVIPPTKFLLKVLHFAKK